MFIDYVTMLLVNMAAGLLVLAVYLFGQSGEEERNWWSVALGAAGFVALVGGLHMTFTWPLPGSFNVVFGEMSIFFGVIFLGIALSVWRDWSLVPVAVYALLPGAVAILLGIRLMQLEMTQSPMLAGVGFILSGLGGMLVLPATLLKKSGFVRAIASLVLIVAAGIWVLIGFGAYWGHVESMNEWEPPTMETTESE